MPQYFKFRIKNWWRRIRDSFSSPPKSSDKIPVFGIETKSKNLERVCLKRTKKEGCLAVELRLYDLPLHGSDFFLSLTKRVLGLEYIYHTSVVVYGTEYEHNPILTSGITSCLPDGPGRKIPIQKIAAGNTAIEREDFDQWIAEVANLKYAGANYSLLHNNCNHFTQDAMFFLGTIIGCPTMESRSKGERFINTTLCI